ncbi:hypothetical protein M378DRAFT_14671 [Amanita muscaria Koide BX008]|uniref:Uncharacterized protein n=1 Tax=Amanita muscaria (strain Koide BX008) TaxID=946122 RepID=A0A0C2WSB9_AMAMK|nr:hypothetical protein M378DRAFT_14671 [Amanita muscaria Koide BX008]
MDQASQSIVNSFVQANVYGIYVTTLILCLRWLLFQDESLKRREKLNIPMLIISIVVFLLETAGLATCFQTTLELQDANSQGFKTLNTINSAVEYTTLQIVDAVLIYRCWVVYGYSWKIVLLPLFLWISSVVLSSYDLSLYVLDLNTTDPDTAARINVLSLQIWDGFFACNIAINIYATTAIVYRIVSVMKDSINPSNRLSQTWRIIAESGALYTISTIVNLVATVLIGNDAMNNSYNLFQLTADPINFTMAGIAFNLILIRVGQQRVADQNKSSVNKRSQWLSTLRFRNARATEKTSSQDPSTLHSNTDYQDV